MEAMDVAVARRFKKTVLHPGGSGERSHVERETLLGVLELGIFENPVTVAVLLRGAAAIVGKDLRERLARLIERAERESNP